MTKVQHLATRLELPASLREARQSSDAFDDTMLAVEAALARVREPSRCDASESDREVRSAWLYLGDVLVRAGHQDQALEAFIEAARIAGPAASDPADMADQADPMTEQVRGEIVRRLVELADGYLTDGVHSSAWNAIQAAIELEVLAPQHTWLTRIDVQVALLRRLFTALIAEGKPDQATAVVSLARALRHGQAELLEQDVLSAAMESLLREARMLRGGLRDIEAWPLLQEAIAMLHGLRAPALDRLTMNLARQLIDAAVVFHCSHRNALAIEAADIVGSFYSELIQRSSGYNASALRELFDDLPAPLRRVAEGDAKNDMNDMDDGFALGSDSKFDVETERGAQVDARGISRGPRVLIVDDSALMLDMAREALVLAGYQVDIAQVLSQITDEDKLRAFDLILMDVMMPELQGDDVAVVLRDEIGGISAPIYLLSSLGEQELSERAEQAGIEGYISKREGIDALVDRVGDILADPSRPDRL